MNTKKVFTPDKVTLEVTKDSYTWTIYEKGGILSRRRSVRTDTGAEAEEVGDAAEDLDGQCDELADAMGGFIDYDIMNALEEIYDDAGDKYEEEEEP